MKFEEALIILKAGGRVRRASWIDTINSLVIDNGEIFYLITPDFGYEKLIPIDKKGYILNSEDLLAEDWGIVE